MTYPVVRWRIDFEARRCVGPGKIALLEVISRTGSLSQAARALGMSYRRAWILLSSLNASFREPVALTARGGRGGGGARVTPLGRQLIRAYRKLDREVQTRAKTSINELLRSAESS